jgi:hypothetical protein
VKKSLRTVNPEKMSKGCLALNPGLSKALSAAPRMTASAVLDVSGGSDTPRGRSKRRKRREMNRTEEEFSRYLQSLKDRGEIYNFSFEGMTLRWGDETAPLSYTADFMAVKNVQGVIAPTLSLTFYEIKGGFAWREGVLRFKAAKAAFPLFEFCLYEKGTDGWQKTI